MATSVAGDSAQQELTVLTQQMDDLQAALEAAEMDRQALAAQRDGWMSSFQVCILVEEGLLCCFITCKLEGYRSQRWNGCSK